MELGLNGRVALVTGGSKGIGRACALGLAAEGCRLVLSARGPEALARTAGELTAKGAEVLTAAVDLTEADAARRVVEAAVARFGRVDILVNNAGAIRGGDFLGTPAEEWAEDWRLKVLGYARMAQAVIPHMRGRRWGRVINIIGAAARNPTPDYMAGGIANAGLVNWTRALADLGASDQILVTAVSPGATATERWDGLVAQRARAQGRPPEELRRELERAQPLGRIGRPEDVADVVVFLASERASFITGICITVDGGASRGVQL
ncbi:MAG: SDR family oxidoreductase [Candidatus Rokubacteria bacterium]|nr:SDR family oxidoreductase [Candidatus Rokubacteria bacterium]